MIINHFIMLVLLLPTDRGTVRENINNDRYGQFVYTSVVDSLTQLQKHCKQTGININKMKIEHCNTVCSQSDSEMWVYGKGPNIKTANARE